MRSGLIYIACLTALLFGSTAVSAQDVPAGKQTPAANQAERRANGRPNLMSQLGLSADQIQQIRKLNMQRRPQMEAAQDRLRSANRSLDEAIYADDANGVDIEARLKDMQAAQADVISLRTAGELAVRRVLTAEQLVRFRDLRSRFEQVREQRQERRRALRPSRNGVPRNTLNPKRRLL